MSEAVRDTRFAMRVSLGFGFLMLGGKIAAYLMTGSAAILSDAAESVIHVVAVAFAAFSLWISTRPPDERFPYGYERVSFFSAGFEGAMIILAAVFIIIAAITKWRAGLQLEHLGAGTFVVAAAAIVNAALGWYLVRTGRRTHSMILEANGKHVLTDSLTSVGVVGGLCLVLLSGWLPFDPLLALAVALNIVWSGGKLVWRSARGLMDSIDSSTGQRLREKLDEICAELGLQYHAVRFRSTGSRVIIELHLLFPYRTPLGVAHSLATKLERRLPEAVGFPTEVVTHLESLEDHSEVHRALEQYSER